MGPWICGPLLGLGLILLVPFIFPTGACGSDTDVSSTETALLLVTATASLATGAAGIWQAVALGRGRGWTRPWTSALLWGAGLVAVLAALVATGQGEFLFVAIPLTCMLLTGVVLLVLLIAWARGRKVGEVGVLLPLYLLGVSLFGYPPLGIFEFAIVNGTFC